MKTSYTKEYVTNNAQSLSCLIKIKTLVWTASHNYEGGWGGTHGYSSSPTGHLEYRDYSYCEVSVMDYSIIVKELQDFSQVAALLSVSAAC